MERARVAYIDGLRAVAVLGVVVCHAAMVLPQVRHVSYLLTEGAHGVDLFFVLSGFCLAYPTLHRLRTSGSATFDVVRYAGHRLVRIVPPYYLAIVVILAATGAYALHSGAFDVPGAERITPLDVVAQALFIDRGTSMVAPPFWTLMVEFRWYFAFPLLLALYVRSTRTYAVLFAVVVAGFWLTRLHDTDLGVFPAFMLGIVAADLRLRHHPIIRYALPLAGIALIAGLLQEPFNAMPDEHGVDGHEFWSQTLTGWHFAAFFFVLAASREGSLLRRILSSRPLAAIGLVSYSVYLVHYPVVMSVAPALASHGFALSFLVASALAVAAGAAFWALCERPFCTAASRDAWFGRVAPIVARTFTFAAVPARFTLVSPIVVTETGVAPSPAPEAAPATRAVPTNA